MTPDLQPTLTGELVELRPLRPDDVDALQDAAADPLIWEQHPEPDRWTPAKFRAYFDDHLASGGALVVVDRAGGELLGVSRYVHDAERDEIEIGWTFLVRRAWGGAVNGELKRLMLTHAFRFVPRVVFLVGRDNLRSRRAVEKLGAREAGERRGLVLYELGRLTLRPLADGDLDALFEWEREPRAVQMAAFTRADPSDRAAFDAHYERVRGNPSNTLLAIDEAGELVGTIASFTLEGEREVSYWIAPERCGQGIASRALRLFVAIEPARPLFGRVASHNAASARVLERAGFVAVGSETSFAPGVGADVVEHIYRLVQ